MDDRRIGLIVRALRRRLSWTQLELSARAHVRQQEISDIERGHLERVRLGTMRRVAGSLDARAAFEVGWRGGMLDRLLDQRHAALVERTARILASCGWQVLPEATFSFNGASGSIDLLAWHEASRSVMVIEVKTELTSVEETLRRLDAKVRVAPKLIEQRLGWRPMAVATLLVVAESTTARRIVATHRATFAAKFPDRGRAVRGWLRRPTGRLAAVWFLPIPPDSGDKQSRGGSHRVRRPQSPRKPTAGR